MKVLPILISTLVALTVVGGMAESASAQRPMPVSTSNSHTTGGMRYIVS